MILSELYRHGARPLLKKFAMQHSSYYQVIIYLEPSSKYTIKIDRMKAFKGSVSFLVCNNQTIFSLQ